MEPTATTMEPITTTKVVHISLTTMEVTPDLVVLNQVTGDTAQWHCDDGDATVKFKAPKGSPFKKGDPFVVHKGHPEGSGGLKAENDLNICKKCSPVHYEKGHAEHYKYEIWRDKVMVIDPEIIIVKSA
ncbi:MAG: hypothetical protein LAO03_22940 [Acidobacteriia bacterium]|nr:hypothetical protein [Terriglobia bacterium]